MTGYDYDLTEDDIRQMLDDEDLYWSGYGASDAPVADRHECAPDPTCPFCRGDLSMRGFLHHCETCDHTWNDDDELAADRDLDFASWLEERATR